MAPIRFFLSLLLLAAGSNTDPRKGETTIVLSDIQRVEPDAALFVVPEDYQYAASQLGVRPQ